MNGEQENKNPSSRTITADCGKRQTAKMQLQQAARALRNRAHELEQLADQVGHISGDAETALWQLIVEARL